MSQPRLAALFLAVLAAGTAVLVTMVALLVQFRGADQSAVWRSLVVALGGVGMALSLVGLVHLSFISARRAVAARQESLVADWLQVWSAVAAGATVPAVKPELEVVAATAAASILQELTGDSAARVRDALRQSGTTAAESRRARRGISSGSRSAVEALERLAWIADPQALPLFDSAVTKGARAARAALLGAMRVLAEQDRPDQAADVIVDMVERYLGGLRDPEGGRPFLTAALLASGAHLGRICTLLMAPGRHEVARTAAIEAVCRSHRPEAGELVGNALLRGLEGETKAAALRGLALIGLVDLSTARVVVDATSDDAVAIRVNAAHALTGVEPELALPALWECLADRAWEVRLAASDTLLRYGSAGEGLLRRAVVEHPDRYARDVASMSLGLAMIGAVEITPDDLLDLGSARPAGTTGNSLPTFAHEARA